MPRLKTFADGSTIFPGDMNRIEDDYEFAFSTYKMIARRSGVFPAGTSTTQILGTNNVLANGGTLTATNGDPVFYLDSSWFNANTRTTDYYLWTECIVGGTAPATTLTVGVYPVTFNTAGAAAFNTVTLGTVVFQTGFTPLVNTQNVTAIGGASLAAGWYALAVTSTTGPSTPTATAASSVQTLYASLLMRQI